MIAINKFMPVCAIAILNVSPFGIPSDTKIPANHMVPVVPMFAPSTHAIAAGSGTAPDATRAIIIGRKNYEYLFSVKLSKTFCIKNG